MCIDRGREENCGRACVGEVYETVAGRASDECGCAGGGGEVTDGRDVIM